jgi:hypothetical protein
MDTSLAEKRVAVGLRIRRFKWPFVFLLTGLGFGLGRYGDLTWGNVAPNPDVVRMFYPIAEAVATGGSLYGPGLGDNKPSGWQLLNVAAYLTGEYTLTMLVVVGVANGLTAILLWRWLDEAGAEGVAVVASILFLLALPLVGGHHINSRPLMVTAVVLGFLAKTPVRRGSAVAVAALFNAYAAAFVIVFLWLVWRTASTPQRAAVRYLATGAFVGVAAFALVGGLWGVDSAAAALHWSYGFPLFDGVATSAIHSDAVVPDSYLADVWLFSEPGRWFAYARAPLFELFALFALAAVGWIHRDRLSGRQLPHRPMIVGGVAALGPLLVRAYEQYWIPVLPFVAVFAATGVVALLEIRDD